MHNTSKIEGEELGERRDAYLVEIISEGNSHTYVVPPAIFSIVALFYDKYLI